MTSEEDLSKKPYELSSIKSRTSNFVMEKWIRQKNADQCMKDTGFQIDRCVCRLGGAEAGTLQSCVNGYKALNTQYPDKTSVEKEPFEPLVWCVNNVPSNLDNTQRDGWLVGCVNAVRKE